MPPIRADQNMLFGILALQMDFIDRDQLIAAMNAWVLDKSQALGDLLIAQEALTPKRRTLLDTLVAEHLDQHGNDPEKSLAAVNAAGAGIGEAALHATLSHLLGGSLPGDLSGSETTTAYQPSVTPCERYQPLRLHAQGGLGEVFVARDEELHREVALKQILHRYSHDTVSRARFVLEAEITGNLEHPGIVPVYGYGQYEDGRPYYAMRFVQGESLKEAIGRFHRTASAQSAARSLQFRKLLSSFVAVCQTVHYAHSRGVLHRDVKPDNIMLGKFGETLVVDWGLAKSLDQPQADAERSLAAPPLRPSSGDGSAQTVAGSTVGTPAYMSPEQAAGRLEDLTTASDVYSLGATLYCVLTGHAPFRGETARVLQDVRSGTFPPPRQVRADVPPALEAICLRAMAHAPGSRYPTARALAEDLEHWLADEPVTAYPEPVATRLARWGRRHLPLVTASAALLLTTVVALAVGLVLLGQAGARTEQQRQLAEANFLEAQKQRDLARENFQMARQAVDDYFVQISENTLLQSKQPGLQPLRKQLLESALHYYEKFVRQGADDPALQAELAQAYFRVGIITGDIGSKEHALTALEQARDLYQALTKAQPDNATFGNELAKTYRAIGRMQALTGRAEASLASAQQAAALGEELVQKNPDNPDIQRDLAWSYNNIGTSQYRSGQDAAARRSDEKAISTWKRLIRRHPRLEFRSGLGQAYSNHGWSLACIGLMPEALEAAQQAVALSTEVVEENRADPNLQANLMKALDNQGYIYYLDNQPTKARQAFERALTVAEPLARDNPAVIEYQDRLANVYLNLGLLLEQIGQDVEAQRAFDKALELAKKFPNTTSDVFSDAYLHRGLGKLLRKQGQTAAALKAFQKAVEVGETNPAFPPFSTYELACARALCAALTAEQAAKRRYADQAVEALRQAIEGGWKNRGWMNIDPDLDGLRDRADFKQLLAELDKQQLP